MNLFDLIVVGALLMKEKLESITHLFQIFFAGIVWFGIRHDMRWDEHQANSSEE